MVVVFLIELVTAALLIFLLVTEIVVPLWLDRPLFPMFRGEGLLRRKLAEAKEKVAEAELEKKIDEKTKEADSVRKTLTLEKGKGN